MKKKFICLIIAAVLVTPLMGNIFPREISTASTLDPQARDVYYLRNAKSGKYLDLQASSAATHTDLQQYPFGYPSELFQLVYGTYTDPDNTQQTFSGYYLKTTLSYASGTMVVDGRSNCVAGAQVTLYPFENGEEQVWILTQNSDGSYCLSPNANTALNMAVSGGSTANNAKVVLATKNSSDLSQRWFLEKVKDTTGVVPYMTYYLRNKNSGMYLDLKSSSTAVGTHLQQYPFGTSGYASERFEITADTGYFVVRAGNLTTRVIDGGGCTNGTQVVLGSYSSSDYAQKWHFKRNDDDGTYCIMSADDPDLNLAVQNGSTASNAKVVLENGSYTTSSGVRIYADRQKWYLEPIDAENFGFQYMFEDEDEFSWISSGYKDPARNDHYAIDIIGLSGGGNINKQPIYSPVSGKVVHYEDNHLYSGRYLVIETDTCWPGTGKKLRLTFAHMSRDSNYSITHTVGDRICVGDLVGYVGNTGDSQGYHLHHAIYMPGGNEFWEKNQTVATRFNPMYFYPYVSFFFYSTVHSTDFN